MMVIPPCYAASTVFDDDDLKRVVHCICDKPVSLVDKMVIYSHRKENQTFGWFCVCSTECFTTNVCVGGA